MMNWMRKAKGSISIFLCLILLPMVTYSTMIIDASRLQSARSVATTAGDLTMNAALSEYEQVLEDMYGLFAVAQSDEDLKSRLKLYFAQTIEGQLMSGESREDYARMMSEELVNMIYDDTEDPETELSNFLEMQLDTFNYEPVNGSALANPAVMKRQIIEYMKYKGPVSLASTLFSKLDFLKNTSKQTEALDNKVKYTKKLSEIEDPCKRAYYAIDGNDETGETGYNNCAALLNEALSDSNSIESFILDSKENYKYMTAYLIMKSSTPITTEITESTLKSEIESGGIKKDYSNIKTMPEDTIEQMESKLSAWIDERNVIVNPLDGQEGDFENRFDAVKVDSTEDDSDFRKSTYTAEVIEKSPVASSFYPTLQRIKDGGAWRSVLDVNYNSSLDARTALSQAQNKFNLQMNIATSGIDDIKQYIVLRDELSEISQEYNSLFLAYHNKMRDEFLKANNATTFDDPNLADAWNTWILGDENSSYHNFYKENKVTTVVTEKIDATYNASFTNFLKALSSNKVYEDYENHYAEEAYSTLAGLYMTLQVTSERLDTAKKALNDVITAIDNAEKAKEEWRKSIGKVDSSSTKSSMMSDYETTTDGLEKKDVEDLISVIDEIKPVVSKMITEMESIKYLDKQVFKLYTVAELGSESGELNYIEQKILDMYSSDEQMPYPPIFTNNQNIMDNLISKGGSSQNVLQIAENLINTKYDRSGVVNSDFVPVTIIDGRPDKQRFFLTLYNICNPVGKEEMSEDTKKEYETVKNDAKQDENVQKNADKLDNAEGTPKEIVKNSPKSEKFDEFMNAIKSYQSDYNDQSNTNKSPDSSTYKTTNVNVPEDDDAIKNADPGSSLTNATSLLDRIAKLGTDIRDDAYMEEYFTEMFTCRTDALDTSKVILLNGYGNQPGLKPLNTNTEWYGKEIEYIIWGDPNLQNNLVKNDVMIYTIRFALNAVYAFTAADIQSFALEVATAIAGWTVIGVPIVQACITIAIALAESAWDLKLLHQGEDVPIYKNASTFVCSPTGALSAIATQVTKDVVNQAANKLEDELDKAVDSVVDSANKTVADCADDMEDYVNDYIRAQADQVKTSIENQFVTPLINKITPVMLTVRTQEKDVQTEVENAIDEAYQSIQSNIENMNDGIVKELSLEFLSTYAESKKSDLVAELTTYFENVDNQTTSGQSIRQLLIGTDKNPGIIVRWIDSFTARINESLGTVKNNMLDNLHSATDQAAGNLKNYMHEQMDSAAEEITGKVSEQISNTVSEYATDVVTDGIDSAASSGGFSLNYKEYCKIFVLLNIAFDETKMLQRSAVLIQANVRNAPTMANPKFEMVNANTLVSVNASVKLGTLFPWTVSDDINDATGDNDVNLDFSHLGTNYITMNYNGINGY